MRVALLASLSARSFPFTPACVVLLFEKEIYFENSRIVYFHIKYAFFVTIRLSGSNLLELVTGNLRQIGTTRWCGGGGTVASNEPSLQF